MAKILVVDDVEDNIRLLEYSLEDDGYEVISARDGIEALEVARQEMPDIILLDLMMPRLNGIEACHKLKDDPLLSDIPVLTVSAADDEEDIIKGLDAGAHDYIAKPINYCTVAARVRSALRVKHYQDSINSLNTELVILKDEAESALRARSSFLATMSHEIRTPITAIMGLSEILSKEDELSPFDNQQASEAILSNSRYLLEVINNILDLSKAESTGLSIEMLDASLFDILEAAETVVQLKAKEKDLLFFIEYNYPIPSLIKTDPTRIKQVIINLVNNALKFTEEGSVRVKVNYDYSSSQLCMEVIDTGIGMSQEEQEKLFQPFQQANETITRRFGGTGLGLTISKDIIENLQGTIEVESKKGVGTTFTVLMPVELPNDSKALNSHPALTDTKRDLDNYCFEGKVLVVEDEPINQKLIAHTLQKVGVTVEIAKDGEEGLEKGSQQPFDLILMDMQLPKIDGVTVIRMLKEKGVKTPVVGLTASQNREVFEKFISVGCQEFVPKPFERAQVYECIRRYLRTSETAPEVAEIAATFPDGERHADMILNYINKLGSRLDDIEAAYQHENWQLLRELAHKLVSAGLFGLSRVSLQAKFLENHALCQDKSACTEIIERLRQEIHGTTESKTSN